jgi:hypothetical protein
LFLRCCIILNLLLIVTDSLYIISKSALNSAAKCQNYKEFSQSAIATGHHSSTHLLLEGLLRRSVKNGSFQDIDESMRIKCTKWFVYYAETD